MKPLVSILIPAYNSQEWLADTLKSAIGQTWERKEIIIIDDGSSDQTLAIAKKFASRNVIVVTQDNQGAAAARNKAFSLSQGDYIQWLDADDLLAPDKIVRQMEALECSGTNRTLLSSAWGRFLYRSHKADFISTLLWCDSSPTEWLIRKMGHNLHMQTATWLVSRELAEAAGPWDTRLSVDDDGEYFCRVLLQSDEVKFVPEARVFYRLTGSGSLSNMGGSHRKLESQFISMKLHIRYLRSLEESERTRSACVRYLQTWFMYFYLERLDIVKEAQQIAVSLGGELVISCLSWKYAWIQKGFGWSLAKRLQTLLPQYKWSIVRSWDKAMSHMERWNKNISIKS